MAISSYYTTALIQVQYMLIQQLQQNNSQDTTVRGQK